MTKTEILYVGKSKTIYGTTNPNEVVLHFRDDATAFNGEKRAVIKNKGSINNNFNAFIMTYLKHHEIPCHFIEKLNDQESLTQKVEIIPVECIVRNITAGSISKRLGIAEGVKIDKPIFEFFLKNDELGDPFINEDHIRFLQLASEQEIESMKIMTHRINSLLMELFTNAQLLLVDFKLEFGRVGNQLVLADEITPDGCRIWDAQTKERLDKDRFRRDLGDLISGYQEICRKLNISLN